MFLLGLFIGIMATALVAMALHRRELRRIQGDPSHLDYLLDG